MWSVLNSIARNCISSQYYNIQLLEIWGQKWYLRVQLHICLPWIYGTHEKKMLNKYLMDKWTWLEVFLPKTIPGTKPWKNSKWYNLCCIGKKLRKGSSIILKMPNGFSCYLVGREAGSRLWTRFCGHQALWDTLHSLYVRLCKCWV